ncbi:hypothetical protein EON81_04240 [bacterium]|nr:MAG: hypothetical protein EON81_04240 [bacterium]
MISRESLAAARAVSSGTLRKSRFHSASLIINENAIGKTKGSYIYNIAPFDARVYRVREAISGSEGGTERNRPHRLVTVNGPVLGVSDRIVDEKTFQEYEVVGAPAGAGLDAVARIYDLEEVAA